MVNINDLRLNSYHKDKSKKTKLIRGESSNVNGNKDDLALESFSIDGSQQVTLI